MGRLVMLLWVLVAMIVVGLGYIRLAPSDPVTWHRMPETAADKDFANGVIRRLQTGPDGLTRLDRIITDTPRTNLLFGSPGDGFATYVTRSAVMGFPDYTTVEQDGDTLTIYARSRFGRSDFGVNRDRVQTWIGLLQPG
ncbi:DUF1499 domain-containing protein [Sedimentitalea sp. JM2-8]|uniref:DUF1499 domain-containing protein n=1 Tax=Sedimentitalea xiamensis TaxID=3050037 RepID=A0ABT7FD78_9RHOB|nr:DUF1499 domain-containing protein [Sedimentitalea xiamensis]MDK3073067.1 DUF1499 domain-containing protein [Sedimentitalea xiamensis]